jgi:orotate phosphoribosyltransferase
LENTIEIISEKNIIINLLKMENYPRAVAEALLDTGSFKISMSPLFTWTSGIKSPVYCDLRALIGDIAARRTITEAFVAMFPFVKEAEVIAGTATAGIPWAAWLADALGKPMVYVRSSAKEHGTQKRVEGFMKKGQSVILIEDLISTGGSSISSVQALKEEYDAKVDTILAINSYQMSKAVDNFAAAGLKAFSITNFATIAEVAKERGVLTADQESILLEFVQDPANWAAKHGLS